MQTQSTALNDFLELCKNHTIDIDHEMSKWKEAQKIEFQNFCLTKYLGNNKFKDSLSSHSMLKSIAYANSLSTLSNQTWAIPQSRRFASGHKLSFNAKEMSFIWMLILENIEKSGCINFKLRFISNFEANVKISKSIQPVDFCRFQQLLIKGLENVSLEFLSFLNTPSLKRISLSSLSEISIKPLIKTNLSFLCSVQITSRINMSYEDLSRIRLSDKQQINFKMNKKIRKANQSSLIKRSSKWNQLSIVTKHNPYHVKFVLSYPSAIISLIFYHFQVSKLDLNIRQKTNYSIVHTLYYSNRQMEIGLATFKTSFSDNRRNQLMLEQDIRILEDQQWQFCRDEAKRWTLIFEEIDSSACEELLIKNDNNSILFKSIIPVAFTRLIKLRLTNTVIINIEAFAFIDAPHLKLLRLSENLISNIKAVDKVHFPKIKYLTLKQKCLPQIRLSRYWMSVPGSYAIYDYEGNLALLRFFTNWAKQSFDHNIGEQEKQSLRQWFKSYETTGFVYQKVFQSLLKSFFDKKSEDQQIQIK